MDWVLVAVLAGATLLGAFGIAAAIAAGASDRASDGTEGERSAIWQAGYAPRDLRLLAGMAAVARVDLAAAQVEVVLWRDGTGVVVTGSRLPPERLGATVAPGDGVAGRALAAGRTIVAGLGEPGDGGAEDDLIAIAAPITAQDGIAGVVAATASGLFGRADVARLEALAADAGARLTAGARGVRHAG
jgi:hypothetical protein